MNVLQGRAIQDYPGQSAVGEQHSGQGRGIQHCAGQVAPIEAHVAAVQPTEVATGEIRVGPVALAYIDPGQLGTDLDVTAGVHAFPAGAGLQPGRRRVQLGGEVWRVGCPLPPLRGPGHAADAVRSRGEGRASQAEPPPARVGSVLALGGAVSTPMLSPGAFADFRLLCWIRGHDQVIARPGRGGHMPPRSSMARATSASGERNPKAMRARSRSLVFTLSMGQCSVDAGPALADGAGEFDERGESTAPGPLQPGVEQRDAFGAFELKHLPKLLLEQVRAIERRVGLGDPGEGAGLTFGEIAGVLPQLRAALPAAPPAQDPHCLVLATGDDGAIEWIDPNGVRWDREPIRYLMPDVSESDVSESDVSVAKAPEPPAAQPEACSGDPPF